MGLDPVTAGLGALTMIMQSIGSYKAASKAEKELDQADETRKGMLGVLNEQATGKASAPSGFEAEARTGIPTRNIGGYRMRMASGGGISPPKLGFASNLGMGR